MLDWVPSAPYTAEQLLEVLRILRDPENGCPWDKVQTHASIRKNFLEETCEVLEAIDADDPAMLREELGDVLMRWRSMPSSKKSAGALPLRTCAARCARSWCSGTRTSLPLQRRRMPV